MTKHPKAALLAVTMLALAPANARAASELISNGGFESGTLAGWTVGYSAGSNLCCYGEAQGTAVRSADGVLGAPIAGNFAAYGDFDGGNPANYALATNIWLRQAFIKTGQAASATLNFAFRFYGGQSQGYVNGYQGYSSVLQRTLTANFLDAGQSLDGQLYSFALPYDQYFVHPVQNVSLDVTALFNGLDNGTNYLDFNRYVPQYYTGAGYFELDGVSLSYISAVPEPASWAMMIAGFGLSGAMLRRHRRPSSGRSSALAVRSST